MDSSKSPPSSPAHDSVLLLWSLRATRLIWFLVYIAWYWISPHLLRSFGETDGLEWARLFLKFSLIIGVPVGIFACIKPNKTSLALFGVISVVHLAIGFGCFPGGRI